MKIMPAFTQSQKRDEPMISTVVVGYEGLIAQYVAEWVDGGDTVEEDSRAEEKSAEIFISTDVVGERTESNGGNEVQTVNNLQNQIILNIGGKLRGKKLWGE